MAIAKTTEFTQQEQDLAAFAKVLSHPARIAIMKVLAKENACICGRIVEILPLAQATVSQHLKELKNAGLIKGTVEGPKSCYCINWEAMEKFMHDFNGMFSAMQLHKGKSCC
jgi:DNA-binding transcriptional ArsR family regulator